jgi:hypothetical protein
VTNDIVSVTRRDALAGVVCGLLAGRVGTGTVSAATADTTVTFDNVGSRAWEVSNVDGDNASAGSGDNPDLTFETTGARYRIENRGWSAHPFALRDSNDEYLLSQDGSGSFEDDGDVNWTDGGDTLAFTLTGALADQVDDYICTLHSSMQGTVAVDAVDYTPESGSVSFTAPSDGATVTAPVSLEMDATDFVVEAASNGVEDGHGHLHALVDKPAVAPGEVIPATEGYNHYGDGSTSATLNLTPGTYTLRLQAGDANHRAYDLTDTVQVTVDAAEAASVTIGNQTFSSAPDTLTVASYDFGTNGESLTIWADPGTGNATLASEVRTTPASGTDVSINLTEDLTETTQIAAAIHDVSDESAVAPSNVISQDRATITVENATEQPEIIEGTPAADTDGDGLLDDLNGNGGIDRGDAQALFSNLDDPEIATNADLLDYNGNGEVDRGDVQALFQRRSDQ